MKALEKDRARRYETAREMVCEIQRYLSLPQGEVGPPTVVHRKISARKSMAVGLAAVFAAVICVLLLIKHYDSRRVTRPGVAQVQRTPSPSQILPPPPPPLLDKERAIAEIEKMGGKVKRNPVLVVDFSDARTRLSDESLARSILLLGGIGPDSHAEPRPHQCHGRGAEGSGGADPAQSPLSRPHSHLRSGTGAPEGDGSAWAARTRRTPITDAGLVHLKGLTGSITCRFETP